jgi:hypothetical protein
MHARKRNSSLYYVNLIDQPISADTSQVNMRATTIDHIAIRPDVLKNLGEPDPGTRTYRKLGRRRDFEAWFDTVQLVCSPEGVLTPGGVGMYTGVSRAGVHKRMREGRLTAFMFHLIGEDAGDGPQAAGKPGGRPYCFIPLSECRAWLRLLRAPRAKPVPKAPPQQPRRAPQAAPEPWRQW